MRWENKLCYDPHNCTQGVRKGSTGQERHIWTDYMTVIIQIMIYGLKVYPKV
jgi:hypothetical protein